MTLDPYQPQPCRPPSDNSRYSTLGFVMSKINYLSKIDNLVGSSALLFEKCTPKQDLNMRLLCIGTFLNYK